MRLPRLRQRGGFGHGEGPLLLAILALSLGAIVAIQYFAPGAAPWIAGVVVQTWPYLLGGAIALVVAWVLLGRAQRRRVTAAPPADPPAPRPREAP